jgi:hypothetical protein
MIDCITAKMDSVNVELSADKDELKALDDTEAKIDQQYRQAKDRLRKEKTIKREDIQRKARVVAECMIAVTNLDHIQRGLDLDEREVSVTETKKVSAKTTRTRKKAASKPKTEAA